MTGLEELCWWDIDQLVGLERVLFPGDSPWTAEMFWSELAAGRHYVVHRAGERVLGYAGLGLVGDDAEVMTIGVDPGAQGRGIGRALLSDLIATAGHRRLLLEVRTDNDRAINLYSRNGFRRVGVRRRYYQPSGADAYTMERQSA